MIFRVKAHRLVTAASIIICLWLLGAASVVGQVIHVPADQPDLAAAISAVNDGGVIEMAGGTYRAPSGGYTVYDLPTPKAFTIRAAAGAAVVFSGGGATDILRIAPSSLSNSRPITFEFLTFADGMTQDNFIGGAITLVNAQAIFKSCTFQNNAANGSGTGGGALWIAGSVASFESCIWTANSSPRFGGGMSVTGSHVYILNSRFTGNRVDVPNHSANAAGGAIYVGDGTVSISNCAFDDNRAGYVGGAIDTNGSWRDPLSTPSVDITIRNSEFTGNAAQFDASVPHGAPALGGAAHFEGQTTARIYNTRFTNNTASQAGAISSYLAITEFTNCVFKGNQATGIGTDGGQGGAILALSSEGPGVNHRSIQLTMTDCLIQGSGSGVKSARQGGCIYAGGDLNFAYGVGGATQNGTVDSNRGVVTLTRVVMADTAAIGDPAAPGGLPGVGGAILGTFINLTMTNCIVENCQSNNSGAGVQLIEASVANITKTTIARCTSGEQGTALTLFGSSLNMSDSGIINNKINGTGRGVGITSAPSPAFGGVPDLEVTGVLQNCLFLNNTGETTIYDGDRSTPPFNKLQYNGNTFFPTGTAYFDDAVGAKTVSELNGLVIQRSDGTSTQKSTSNNIEGSSSTSFGQILMVPQTILGSGAPGETLPLPSYIAYAATSAPAIDGALQPTDAGIFSTSTDGTHALVVGGVSFSTPPSPPAVALNISTRLPVGTGENALIGGFIIAPQGSSPKRVLIRAIGPSLPVAGALQDPVLSLIDSAGTLVATNDNWRTTQPGGVIAGDQAVEIAGTGVAPTNDSESAIIATLYPFPQTYTAVVRGVGNTTGNGLVEVFDLDAVQTSRLANISTRGFVQTGDNVMIGGFIYDGGAGATNVVLRALGPSLTSKGVSTPLSDPTLDLVNAQGTIVATNDDWQSAPNAAALQSAGLAPSDPHESAIYKTDLARGSYTGVVRGKNGGTGVGLVEVYVF